MDIVIDFGAQKLFTPHPPISDISRLRILFSVYGPFTATHVWHKPKEMPLSKQYLRYEHAATLGVVHGRKSNLLLTEAARAVGAGKGRRALVVAPTVEDVIVWDPRRGDKAGIFKCYQFFLFRGKKHHFKSGSGWCNPCN